MANVPAAEDITNHKRNWDFELNRRAAKNRVMLSIHNILPVKISNTVPDFKGDSPDLICNKIAHIRKTMQKTKK